MYPHSHMADKVSVKMFIEPPTMYQTLFLDGGNIVVIKTQKSPTSWNLHSCGIKREFKQATVLSFLAKSLKPKIQFFFISSYHHCNYICSQFI